MTYIGYYFDEVNKEIVLAQDTLALSTIDYSFSMLLDKTFYHKQSKVLIGSNGNALILGVSGGIFEEVYKTYDEALQGIVQAAVRMRTMGQEILAEHPMEILDTGVTQLFVFGFDENGEPKLSIVSFSGVGFSNVPVVFNQDKELKAMTNNAYYIPISIQIPYSSLPDDVTFSHGKTFDMYSEAIKNLKLSLNNDTVPTNVTSLLISTALYGHVSSCFKPVGQGGIGASIGGELIEYRINVDKEYKEKSLFVFPDNNLHGIPDNVTRMRLDDIISAKTFDDLPLAYQGVLKQFKINADNYG